MLVLVAGLVAAVLGPSGDAIAQGSDPGAGAGGFSDVDPDGVHAPAVEGLAALGVFVGTECGDGLFCPGDPVQRWVMAVWMVRVLEPDRLPTGEGTRFADVDAPAWYAPYVERLADLGVTKGCRTEPLRFCPGGEVTRAQMASFLTRAFELEPPDTVEGFEDVGDGVHTEAIYALAASGITKGCRTEPLRFCPGAATSKAQMASFLKRAYTAFIGPCPSEDGGEDEGGEETGPVPVPGPGSRSRPPGPGPGPGPTVQTPAGVAADPGDRSLTVTWGTPSGSVPVVEHRVQWRDVSEVFGHPDRQASVPSPAQSYRVTGLVNGNQYWTRVQHVSEGNVPGAWSQPVTAVPANVADPPSGVTAASGDESVTVSWTPPADAGSAALTGYVVQWRADNQGFDQSARSVTVAVDARSHEVSGLRNGTKYWVRVRATTARGDGTASGEVSVVPAAIPSVPRNLRATRGDGAAVVEWDAPADDGGSPVTEYRVAWRDVVTGVDSEPSVAGDVLRLELSGLTNGNEHVFRVRAVNAVGEGPRARSVAVTPASVPGSPVSVAAVRGDRSVDVLWSPPADNGGAQVASFTVYWSPDDQFDASVSQASAAAAAESYRVSRLTNGTEYFVRVAASNDVGEGSPSATVSATPATVPGRPGSVGAERGDGTVTVSWGAPSDGGSEVTGYKVQWRADGDQFDASVRQAVLGAGASSRSLSSLTNGTEYFVRVLAVNAVGDGPWSSTVSAVPARAAGPPQGVSASGGDRSVTVSWGAPSDDGGETVTGYKVQWRAEDQGYTSGRTRTVGADVSSQELSGLRNGTKYWARVRAVNALGDGAVSDEDSAVPATVPGRPSGVAAARGDRSLSVSWRAAPDGGSDVTGYKVEWSDDEFASSSSVSVGGDVLSRRIAGLTNGTRYWTRVSAVNAVGAGPVSTRVSAVPATVPGRPSGVAAARGDRSLSVSWGAPSDGGSAITGYKVEWSDDEFASSSSVSVGGGVLSRRIAGLTNGTRYWARVSAVNAVGAGPVSTRVSAVPATVPGRPSGVAASAGDRSLSVSWGAPSDGGSAVTGYKVQWRADGEQFDASARQAVLGAGASSRSLSSLTNGTRYFVRVLAANAVGDGQWSLPVSAVPASAPRPPTVTASAADKAVKVSWSPPGDDGGSDITGYRVQWRADDQSYSSTERVMSFSSSARSHRITGLSSVTKYWARVQAVNAIGASSWAGSSATTPASQPDAPTGLDTTRGDTTMTVSWSAPADDGGSDITGYKVQWRSDGQAYSSTERSADVAAATLSRQITSLSNSTKYWARVQAVNSSAASDWAEAASEVPGPPGQPASLVLVAGNQRILVSWSAPADDGGSAVTGYKVQWRSGDQAYSTTERFADADAATVAHQITGLTNGAEHTVRVSAVNVFGQGTGREATATPATVPGKPQNMQVAPRDRWLLVTWEAPADDGGAPVESYRVQWRKEAETYSTSACSLRVRTLTISDLTDTVIDPDSGVETETINLRWNAMTTENGEPWSVQVTAVNTFGAGSPADEATATPVSRPCLPIESFFSGHGIVAEALETGITVSWPDPICDDSGSDVTGYQVEWRTDDEEYTTYTSTTRRTSVGLSPRSYNITGLTTGTKYWARVRSVNAVGVSHPSPAQWAVAGAPGRVTDLAVALVREELYRGFIRRSVVKVSWTAAPANGSDITGYKLKWGIRGGFNVDERQLGSHTLGADATSRDLQWIYSNPKYYVEVTAVNERGDGYTDRLEWDGVPS